MEALSSPGRSDPQHSVVGLGSNLFRQIRQGCNQDKETLDLDHDADEIVIGPVACVGIDAQHQAILGVVAANWSQIIFRSARPDSLIARGYDYQSLQLHLDRICAQPCNDSKDRTVIAWLGEDAFTAYIDTDGLLQQLAPVSNASEGPRRIHGLGPWRTAAMDKRGRIVAIDLAGNAYLFASVSEMMAAANAVDSAELEDLQHRYRFAFPGAPDSRPVFTAVVAGWAHFVLVADSAIWPLWALGDTRFGVVPMPPRLSTAAKGAAGRLDGREERPDEELLVPLEFFSRFRAGFPTSVAQVACGGRHVLVRTDSGDVYGWGWNGQGQICRLQQQPGGVHDEALTQPVLVELPVQRGQAEPVIVDIACGSDHSVLVGQHGELWIAGSNEHGQLGMSWPSRQSSPSDADESLPTSLDAGERASSATQWRPSQHRAISQTATQWPCSDGPISHPAFGPRRPYAAQHAICGGWNTVIDVVTSTEPEPCSAKTMAEHGPA